MAPSPSDHFRGSWAPAGSRAWQAGTRLTPALGMAAVPRSNFGAQCWQEERVGRDGRKQG